MCNVSTRIGFSVLRELKVCSVCDSVSQQFKSLCTHTEIAMGPGPARPHIAAKPSWSIWSISLLSANRLFAYGPCTRPLRRHPEVCAERLVINHLMQVLCDCSPAGSYDRCEEQPSRSMAGESLCHHTAFHPVGLLAMYTMQSLCTPVSMQSSCALKLIRPLSLALCHSRWIHSWATLHSRWSYLWALNPNASYSDCAELLSYSDYKWCQFVRRLLSCYHFLSVCSAPVSVLELSHFAVIIRIRTCAVNAQSIHDHCAVRRHQN